MPQNLVEARYYVGAVRTEKGVDVQIAADPSHSPSFAMIRHATLTKLLSRDDFLPFLTEAK